MSKDVLIKLEMKMEREPRPEKNDSDLCGRTIERE